MVILMVSYVSKDRYDKKVKSLNMWIEQLLLQNKKLEKRIERLEKQLGLEPLPENDWKQEEVAEA